MSAKLASKEDLIESMKARKGHLFPVQYDRTLQKWRCECKRCGRTDVLKSTSDLRKVKSCGCLLIAKAAKRAFNFQRGQMFADNQVEVVERVAGPHGWKGPHCYKCLCHVEAPGCKGEFRTRGSRLQSGRTQSCGCLRKQRRKNFGQPEPIKKEEDIIIGLDGERLYLARSAAAYAQVSPAGLLKYTRKCGFFPKGVVLERRRYKSEQLKSTVYRYPESGLDKLIRAIAAFPEAPPKQEQGFCYFRDAAEKLDITRGQLWKLVESQNVPVKFFHGKATKTRTVTRGGKTEKVKYYALVKRPYIKNADIALLARVLNGSEKPLLEYEAPHEQTPQGTGRRVGRLNDADKAILILLSSEVLKGQAIALRLGLNFDYVRRRLARLGKLGYVANDNFGYRRLKM